MMSKMTPAQQDLWENDPYVFHDNPEYLKKVELGDFRMCAAQGMTPEQAFPKDDDSRKRYAEFLKSPR